MGNKKKIEIPFGAFDSELIHQEINIPNGFKAVIEGNKIILTRAESEDERIRKALIEMVHDTTGDELWVDYNVHKEEALAWLEKQGEHNKNHKTMIVKYICKKDWHGIGDYYYGKIYNGYPCEKEQKGYDIYDDNHVPTFCDEDFINEYFNIVTEEKQDEQKSAEWSEEDSVRLQRIIDFLWYNRKGDTDTIYQQEQDIDWLKSLKQRIGG